jgi:hypothetical protein
MGFHKRFITKETILSTNKEHINTLFGADALLFSDEWSSRFYELLNEGYEYNEIIEKLNKDEDN